MPSRQLPPLNSTSTVPSASAAGDWSWHSEKVLSKIAESLEADVNPRFFDVDSIPDIWARPILFKIAFSDRDHPLHSKILGEWRGMMTLIALSEWQNPPLEVRPIDLSVFKDGDGTRSSSAQFANAASRMVPEETIDQQTGWHHLHLFRYDGDPVAITSPTTLVATAPDYSAYGVRWFDGEVLRDPIGTHGTSSSLQDELSNREKTAVKQWLRRLQDTLTESRSPSESGEESWSTLLTRIRGFIDDLLPESTSSQFEFANSVFAMSTGGVLRHLDDVPSPPQPDPENSHVRLVPEQGREDSDRTNLLIIEEEIARQWSERTQDVAVYGVDTLASIPTEGGNRDVLNGRHMQDAEWRYADDLFVDRLGVIDESAAFNQGTTMQAAGAPHLDITPVLPLDEELLEYLSPRSLARRTRFTEVGDGYRVEVDLPLSGSGAEPQDVTFEHTYGRDDLTVRPEIPFFEIWPDFEAPDWSEYYSYYGGVNCFYLETYPRPADGEMRADELRTGEVRRAIGQTQCYPEAALCHSVEGDRYLGFVALNPPERAAATSTSFWTVGVDFGTSNTTAYVSEDSGETGPIRFEDRLAPITDRKNLRLTNTRDYFFPARAQDVPFLTFFHDLPTAREVDPGRDIQVPQEGHILYVDSPETREDLDRVHHDLKWSDAPADRARTKAFLEQISLQVRAEAAANRVEELRWRYSYPSSFSQNQLDSIRSTWADLSGPDDVEQRSESLSTAIYFLESQNASMSKGSVCVDIGGASTDVAIWQDYTTLLQSSLLLAGRETFLKTIAADLGRYTQVFDSSDYETLAGRENSSQGVLTDLEELIVLKGDDLLERLPMVSGTEAAARLRQHIGLGIAGIFHYIGLLLRHLVEEGAFDPEAGLPNFYFGGNGSKMLHWLDEGRFGEDSRINGLFEKVLVEASGLEQSHFEVQLTPASEVKHEVACGLVFDRNLEVQSEGSVVAGEAFAQAGEQRPWHASLAPEVLSGGAELEDLSQLRALVETFNEFAENSEGLLNPLPEADARFSRTREHVRGHLREYQGMESEDIDVESIFILGVKGFLDTLRES
jgi:hypothetical protein